MGVSLFEEDFELFGRKIVTPTEARIIRIGIFIYYGGAISLIIMNIVVYINYNFINII